MGLYDNCCNMNDVRALSGGRSIMDTAQAEETFCRCPICDTSYECVLLDDRLEDTKFWYIAQCFCNRFALRHTEHLSGVEKEALIQNELKRAKEKERAYEEEQQKKAEQDRIYEEQRRREEQARRRAEQARQRAEQLQWEREAPLRLKRERRQKAKKICHRIGFFSSIVCAVISAIMFFTVYMEICGIVIIHILPFLFLLFTSGEKKILRIICVAASFILSIFELNWIIFYIFGYSRTIEQIFALIIKNVTFNRIGIFEYIKVNIIFIPIISNITACILVKIFPSDSY